MRVRHYKKFYKKLRALDGEMRKRAEVAMQDIVSAEDPTRLGDRKCILKKGIKCVIYTYGINRSNRLAYGVAYDSLHFICVGDHKTIYGKD